MPQNGFSLGKDVTLVVVNAQGPFQFSGISRFTAKQDVTDIKVKGLDGTTTPLKLPDAWSGTFDYDRKGGQIDDYFSGSEQAYFDGANQLNVSIVEIIREPDGSISEYAYLNVAMHLDDAGTWAGDARTTQRIAWMAARRVKRL